MSEREKVIMYICKTVESRKVGVEAEEKNM
jgi:hypothetical protein